MNSRGRGRALARALVVGGALAHAPATDGAAVSAAPSGAVGLARLQAAPALDYAALLRPSTGATAGAAAPVPRAPPGSPAPVAWPLGGVERSRQPVAPGSGAAPPTLRLAQLGAGTFVVLVAMAIGASPAFAGGGTNPRLAWSLDNWHRLCSVNWMGCFAC